MADSKMLSAEESLLPPLMARDENWRALASLVARLNTFDLQPLLVYDVDQVAADVLPVLAEQFSLTGEDGWALAESDEARRELIKGAIELHRYKGTPWSIREVIRRLGFGEVTIVEGLAGKRYDGAIRYDGLHLHGFAGAWAMYRVILERPITNDQAANLRHTLAAFAPVRCLLASLDYQAVPIRYNGVANYDGQYNHGSA